MDVALASDDRQYAEYSRQLESGWGGRVGRRVEIGEDEDEEER
jgi:hypothetical protein